MKTYQLIFIYLLSLIISITLKAQADGVAIGASSANESAILHIQPPSNNKGLLIPRLSSDPSNNTIENIDNPADGLVVYDTYSKGFVYWDESLPDIPASRPDKWVQVTPQGMITMWSGTTPPKGWVICDGNNNTPDLRGRFIVSYSAGDSDYNNPGNISEGGTTEGARGGDPTVTLGITNIPSHNHPVNLTTNTTGSHTHSYVDDVVTTPNREGDPGNRGGQVDGYSNQNKTTGASGNHSHTLNGNTGNAGSASPSSVDIRPPYYVLAFIMKL
ncbi:hypothetical protein [Ekhidna sp.]